MHTTPSTLHTTPHASSRHALCAMPYAFSPSAPCPMSLYALLSALCSMRNIWYMRQFYLEYYRNANLQPLVGEISWTKHIVIMSRCKDNQTRKFYITMTKKFGWTKNVLIHHIENQSFKKTLANQTNFNKTVPAKIRKQAKLAVKDEYALYRIKTSLPKRLVKYLPSSKELARQVEILK